MITQLLIIIQKLYKGKCYRAYDILFLLKCIWYFNLFPSFILMYKWKQFFFSTFKLIIIKFEISYKKFSSIYINYHNIIFKIIISTTTNIIIIISL